MQREEGEWQRSVCVCVTAAQGSPPLKKIKLLKLNKALIMVKMSGAKNIYL